MLVRDLMERDILKVTGDLTIADVCDLFQRARVHGAAVVDDAGKLVGFVSQEDVLYGSMSRPVVRKPRPARKKTGARTPKAEPPGELRVRDIMTAPAVSATEEAEVLDLCRMMWTLRIHHVPIVMRGRVTGMVSTMVLCKAIADGTIRISRGAGGSR